MHPIFDIGIKQLSPPIKPEISVSQVSSHLIAFPITLSFMHGPHQNQDYPAMKWPGIFPAPCEECKGQKDNQSPLNLTRKMTQNQERVQVSKLYKLLMLFVEVPRDKLVFY